MSDTVVRKTYALFANPASRKIVGELENSNADVISFPPIKTEKNRLDETAIETLKNLHSFDWLIFPDVLTVEYFLETLEENHIDLFELDFTRVCAAGESVADRLRYSSIHSDVIPQTVEADDILSAIINYVGEGNLGSLRFLFPKEISTREELTERLNAKGAFVSEMPIYAADISRNLATTKLKTLLKGGAIDEFILTAPDDFVALKHYFKNESFSEIFSEIKVSAADGAMLQAARENNLSRAGLFHLGKLDKVKR